MQRKNSHSIKRNDNISSMALARKVYTSNKALKRKQTITRIVYASINQSQRCPPKKKFRASSCYDNKPTSSPVPKQFKVENLPTLKNIESDSTAEDLMQRVNKKITKQPEERSSAKSFLVSRVRKCSRIDTMTKQQNLPPVAHENSSTNIQTKRKIFQCKIIRSSKIPFALPKVKEQKNKLNQFIEGMEDISEIKRQPFPDFISPESQDLIDF